MQRILPAALLVLLCTCKSAPTTRQTAETLSDAARTQTQIDRAEELAEEIETASTDEARDKATDRYIAASKKALTSSEQTIDNLRKSLIASEEARGLIEQKLADCRPDAEKFVWLKWLLIIGGPLSIVGAFLLGRKL